MLLLLLCSCLYDRDRFLELSQGFVDDDHDGYREIDGDCNDDNPDIHPDVIEVCDGLDNDCQNGADGEDAADIQIWYQDQDQDGYGLTAVNRLTCQQPYLYSSKNGDCDDDNIELHPDAVETCTSGIDSNCDGYIQHDQDGDGYNCDDCDDGNPDIHPDAPEYCNDNDDNCDLIIDQDPVDPPTWYSDNDGDGYGTTSTSIQACKPPTGFVSNDEDCDDATADAAPGLPEVCGDGLDTNCDGVPGNCKTTGKMQPIATLIGVEQGGELGYWVASMGDINLDGYDDLLASAPHSTDNVYTLFGPFAGNVRANAVASLLLSGPDGLGTFVANAGDQDGDGRNDLLVSSCTSPDFKGDVYLMNGQLSGAHDLSNVILAHLEGTDLYSCAGAGMAGNFDWQGDGQSDLMLAMNSGSYSQSFIFNGPIVGELDIYQDAAIQLVPAQQNDGFYASNFQDLDGDGLTDILATASQYSDGANIIGSVYLFQNVSEGVINSTDADRQWVGRGDAQQGVYLSVADDPDGDGYLNVWVSAGDDSSGWPSGTTRLLGLNSPSGVVDDVATTKIFSYGGCCSTHTSDLNLDGHSDLVLSDNSEHDGTQDAVFVFYGPVVGTVDTSAADAWYWGASGMGYSLEIADTDDDGNPEIVTGAYTENNDYGAIILLEIQVW